MAGAIVHVRDMTATVHAAAAITPNAIGGADAAHCDAIMRLWVEAEVAA